MAMNSGIALMELRAACYLRELQSLMQLAAQLRLRRSLDQRRFRRLAALTA